MITYKQVLNKGLVKEAAPWWVKQVRRLNNLGQYEKITSMLFSMARPKLRKLPVAGPHQMISPVPEEAFINGRKQKLIERFINWRGANRFKRGYRNFIADDLYRRVMSDKNRPGDGRFRRWLTVELDRLGFKPASWSKKPIFQLSYASNLTGAPGSPKSFIYRDFLQRRRPFIYLPESLEQPFDSEIGSIVKHFFPSPSIIKPDLKASPVNIEKLSDYIFGGKNLTQLFDRFNNGHRIFFSPLLQVAKQYKTGFSGNHEGKQGIVAILKNKLKDLLYTPHFAVADNNKRRELLEKFIAKQPVHIHNPSLAINNHPMYETVVDKATNPDALKYALLLQQISPDKYIGRPMKDVARKNPLTALVRDRKLKLPGVLSFMNQGLPSSSELYNR